MNILLVLIPVTLVIVVVAVRLFFWAVNHQQFDDLDSPAVLPLLDEPATDATPAELPADRPAEASADRSAPAGAAPPATGDAADDRPA
jgi:cbb3-type cytochrome oxidase maturation protein